MWTKTSEKKPGHGQWVLAVCHADVNRPPFKIAIYENVWRTWTDQRGHNVHPEPSHWMPLPEPPEGE